MFLHELTENGNVQVHTRTHIKWVAESLREKERDKEKEIAIDKKPKRFKSGYLL